MSPQPETEGFITIFPPVSLFIQFNKLRGLVIKLGQNLKYNGIMLSKIAQNKLVLIVTLAVAVRTYALNNFKNSLKYNGKRFNVDADIDHVYRGYAFEEQMLYWSKAIDETQGMIVAYKNEVAATPYFARSSGRTRTWSEAWRGANKPWIKSVKASYDKGYPRLRHGVWDIFARCSRPRQERRFIRGDIEFLFQSRLATDFFHLCLISFRNNSFAQVERFFLYCRQLSANFAQCG